MNTFDYRKDQQALHITIYSRGPGWAKWVLALLTFTAILAFIRLAYQLSQTAARDGIMLVLSFVVFGLVMSFLSRLLLWNTFGKEYLIFQEGEFRFQYDYKLFKSEWEKIPFSDVKASRDKSQDQIIDADDLIDGDQIKGEHGWDKGRLKLQFDQGQHLSPVELAKEDLLRLIDLINQIN